MYRLTIARTSEYPSYIPRDNANDELFEVHDELGAKCVIGEAVDRLAEYENTGFQPEEIIALEKNHEALWGKIFDREKGCCWCIADDLQNKTYIRTDDSEYTFIEAKYCPKCGKKLCE
jgi:hypothetical protein